MIINSIYFGNMFIKEVEIDDETQDRSLKVRHFVETQRTTMNVSL